MHGREEHAARLPQDDGRGGHSPFEPGNEPVEGLRGTSEHLLRGGDIAEVAAQGIDLDVDAVLRP